MHACLASSQMLLLVQVSSYGAEKANIPFIHNLAEAIPLAQTHLHLTTSLGAECSLEELMFLL
jgi:hypothetical protein